MGKSGGTCANQSGQRSPWRSGVLLPVTVDAPEARQDVPEAGVAVQFGLALGALDGALQPPTQEALPERECGLTE